MRRWQLLLPGLFAALLAGCTTGEPVRSTSLFNGFRPLQGPAGPDVVVMDLVLLERPVGDAYLDRELWEQANEQGMPLEKKGVLEDNGFHVGQLGGIPPDGLRDLLNTERACVNPRRITLRAGRSWDLLLGPVQQNCRFWLHGRGEPEELQFENAQLLLVVTPALGRDGKTVLHFTPQVRHGETRLVPRPADDLSGWVLRADQATEKYADLGWELSLTPNEYAVVGGRTDSPVTLGHVCFIRRDESPPVQRVLVIRTRHATPSVADELGDEEPEPGKPAPPVALHAPFSAPRAPAP